MESSHPGCREPSGLFPTRRRVTEDGPRPLGALEPSPPGSSIVVLTGRATRVPQAAGTGGIQRTITVTSRRPVGWAPVPDLGWGGARNCMVCKGSRLSSALPCPAGRSVPGAGGPERRRRPRPDGTGTLSLLTACSRDRPTLAGTARDSHPWGRGEGPRRRACVEPDGHLGTALQRLITQPRAGGPLPTRQGVTGNWPHPPVQLVTVPGTAGPRSSSPAVPSACP